MEIHIENPISWGKKISVILIVIGILAISGTAGIVIQEIKAQSLAFWFSAQPKDLAIAQGNTLLAMSNPSGAPKPAQKIKMVVTAYSSTTWQTDSDPFVTASGSEVKEGIVANNLLPFGTQIRIPEIYGDKVFVVEDRMHWRKGYYHLDIWFLNYWEAKDFGAKRAYIEILES